MPKANLYVGRAGQMAVMAEFLVRGYNVAVPEVDIGDDILVVKDDDGAYARVQVKAAKATKTSKGYSASYALKFSQVEFPSTPETWFVFANRLEEKWQSFVIIPRSELYIMYDKYKIGSLNQSRVLSLYFSYSGAKVSCSGQDFSHYLNNWSGWPYIKH